MPLTVHVAPASLRQSTQAGPVSGELWFDFGTVQFPDTGWRDLVVPVLGWWAPLARSVRHSRHGAKFVFMDGPFEIVARPSRSDHLRLECFVARRYGQPTQAHEVPSTRFEAEVLSAATLVLRECRERGFASPDVDVLAAHVEGWPAAGEATLLGAPEKTRPR